MEHRPNGTLCKSKQTNKQTSKTSHHFDCRKVVIYKMSRLEAQLGITYEGDFRCTVTF